MATTPSAYFSLDFLRCKNAEEVRTLFYQHQDNWLKSKWKEAQSLPMRERLQAEEQLIETLAERSQCKGLSGDSLSLLIRFGNLPGYAFSHGLTIHWFPSRGIAKHAYCKDRAEIRANDGRGREALGPAPTTCTLLDALKGGRGFCQAHITHVRANLRHLQKR